MFKWKVKVIFKPHNTPKVKQILSTFRNGCHVYEELAVDIHILKFIPSSCKHGGF